MSPNTIVRILVFAVGLPLLAAIAFVSPEHDLPAYALLVIGAAAVAAREAAFFFPTETRLYTAHAAAIPLTGALLPAIGWVTGRIHGGVAATEAILVTIFAISVAILGLQVIRRTDQQFTEIVPAVGMHIFLLVYPGLFAWYAIRLAFLPAASWVVLLFVFSVYLNDSFAWLFGRLFGKSDRGGTEPIVAVSPNKSRIGFLAGFLTTPAVVVIGTRIVPDLPVAPLLHAVIFGAVVGASAILGDLVESALKRSAAIKDSGQIIPGRGGLLDSIDSPLLAAPFFYYGYVLVFLS